MFTSYHGGCWIFQKDQQAIPFHLPPTLPFYTFNSGPSPQPTSDCVKQTHKTLYSTSSASITEHIENTIAPTIHQLIEAIRNENTPEIAALIHENHQWLCQMRVVPSTLQAQINTWQTQATDEIFAAKISGAGALSGDKAGCILLFGRPPTEISDSIEALSINQRGCHATH